MSSNGTITSETFVRHLSHGVLRTLADFLDPYDAWKKVLMDIPNGATGQPRFSQLHLRRFEGLLSRGGSPTVELLHDWGTTNCTVGELVEILLRHRLYAPAGVLLPGVRPAQVQPALRSVLPLSPQPGHVGLDAVRRPAQQESRPPPACQETAVLVGPTSGTDDTGFCNFSYHDLMRMTGNWDDRSVSVGGNRLGEGGFGIVYRGLLNSTHVAVKKLSSVDDICAEELRIQFDQEVQALKTLKHENLVNMVGFSSDGNHPCLVYAYMPNGSLLDRLACLDNTPPLSWHRRCLISTGTAKGLEYLHSNHHVHRDVKSANILLDEKFIPKVSDFGLTRASAKRSSSTVMTEKIVGTTAYMAPEALRGEITPKSDVFSFGVVLLEILSGLPPVDESRETKFIMDLRDEVEEEEMDLDEFVDKKMEDRDLTAAEKVFSLASQCLSDRKNRRPPMKGVLTDLQDAVKTD
ncbi:interleukin-1 receptor-associated kinase 4 isoform X1 [Denticeps clupeoides]|uniref:interleukin-1 receptor-associated kinase 4 isoform X1 n=1 Tax=Denticeps clupeoides TaxID=299321 RepID=UPI0010A49D3A|nr:interleukin-1 receptor-associated kinase 4 isoform X1 [Denticeps clupeoides]